MIIPCSRCGRQFELPDALAEIGGGATMCGKCAEAQYNLQAIAREVDEMIDRERRVEKYKVCRYCGGLGKVVKEQADES